MLHSKIAGYPNYGSIQGSLVIIGYGSIGRATLPLLSRHFTFDPARVYVIEPDPAKLTGDEVQRAKHIGTALTAQNYRDILTPLFEGGSGFCVNLSVGTSSRDLMALCRELGVNYIDTVTEPWEGFYFSDRDHASRTNYVLREEIRADVARAAGSATAVSCCGANPGMVSWLVKTALLRLAEDLDFPVDTPRNREGWAHLMANLGVHGVHIAERDTQKGPLRRKPGSFVNTWSVEGFIAEAFQPAELGWGTRETRFPVNGRRHSNGCQSAIWLEQAGAMTRVRSWCPAAGAQIGYLITHNEAISIADYYTVGDKRAPLYRPTCHYAYHPCDDALLSLHETLGSGQMPADMQVLGEDEIHSGSDELGVLLYGHARNALWYGSRLSIEEARALAPNQNATGLQVSSAVLAGMVFALENPKRGIVEADEMDFARCLEVQQPYLGRIEAHYTDWTPLNRGLPQFDSRDNSASPWAFENVLIS